ncbi:MAG: DUF1343 domain-containing protein, partial [Smithellaceae bacterium]
FHWIPPSPNLPSYESSIIYSAVVLLEGTNFSVGRGTSNPFEYIGAPWVEPELFCSSLPKKAEGISDSKFRKPSTKNNLLPSPSNGEVFPPAHYS